MTSASTGGRVARVLLSKLRQLGIEYIFATPGSEFIPLIEEYRQGGPFPTPIVVPHEALAVNMAHGFFLTTGRPQAVMVHFTVGTANALLGLMGASRMNVPLLFLAGRAPVSAHGAPGGRDRFIHWAQESFDQGAMTREFVKWDYELRRPDMVDEVLTRAWEIMTSAPRGPVSLSIPREHLYEAAVEQPFSLPRPIAPLVPSEPVLSELVTKLQGSERGVVISSRSGLDPQTVPRLAQLCERFQLGVLCPQAQALNLSTAHSCFLGFEDDAILREADLILSLDTDVPWLPARVNPAAAVIQLGPDPLFERLPMRSFPSALTVRAELAPTLELLVARAGPDKARSSWLLERRRRWETEVSDQASQLEHSNRLTGHAVAKVLSPHLGSGVVLLNELSLPPHQLGLAHAGGYLRSGSASALGWALPCALGIKLARPELTPLAVVGDGVYYLSNPLAVQWMSQALRAPLVTLILNNEGMPSVHAGPEFTSLRPTLPFAEMAAAGGAFGARVETRAELDRALTGAFEAARQGKMGVIDARLS
jgi:acetolactate synthase-1/2/3 large subunit